MTRPEPVDEWYESASGTPTPKGPVVGWRYAAALRALHAAGLTREEQPDGVRKAIADAAALASEAAPASGEDDIPPQPTPDEEREAVLAERLDWEAEQEKATATPPEPGLDAAWAAAEAALPEGAWELEVAGKSGHYCVATAHNLRDATAFRIGDGPTPAAALLALAARLSASPIPEAD